jgi:alpha-tubulin suppressor-like RCC1 family protein
MGTQSAGLLGTDKTACNKFCLVDNPIQQQSFPSDARIVDVVTAGLSDFALSRNGTMFGWGNNGDRVLRTGPPSKEELRPLRVRMPRVVKTVQISADSTNGCVLALTRPEPFTAGAGRTRSQNPAAEWSN